MYVYFIQGQVTRLVKIGHTKDPKSRLASIRTNSPDKVKLIKLIKAEKGDEQIIHNRFASVRSHGEWFYPSRKLMEYIDGLKKARMPSKTKAQKNHTQRTREARKQKRKEKQERLQMEKEQQDKERKKRYRDKKEKREAIGENIKRYRNLALLTQKD